MWHAAAVLVEYDDTWPDRFAAAAAELTLVSGGAWVVEHIGSTAVLGCPAKPIIDLAVRVEEQRDVERLVPDLLDLGWSGIAAGPRTHHVRVKQWQGHRTHIAHFFAAAQWDTCHQRVFRDWLRTHPDDLARYAAVKRAAVAEGLVGRAYTERKTAIVQDIVDRARAARGLSPGDVWDK
jgi:GrpB-like predicted nucleotidyltransferase (UPF0157 family)